MVRVVEIVLAFQTLLSTFKKPVSQSFVRLNILPTSLISIPFYNSQRTLDKFHAVVILTAVTVGAVIKGGYSDSMELDYSAN